MRESSFRAAGGAVLAWTLTAGIAFAQQAPAEPPAGEGGGAAAPAAEQSSGAGGFFRDTEVGVLLDTSYDWFSTRPSGDALYRNFDTRHNQFMLNLAEVWLSKTPTADSRAGYRVKLFAGHAAELVQSYEPEPSLLHNVEEGFVSYLAPVGKGLQFDVGKFATQHGAEVIEAKDNWNYSRSLLFALAIPYYHAGVRVTYAPNDKVSFMGNVVNGWNDVTDNNSAKTIGAQVILKPTESFTFVQNFMTGPEQPGDNDDWRRLFDTIATYTVNPRLSLMANYDYGADTVAGVDGHWQGVAGYARVQANDRVAFTPRVEVFDDPDGFSTGTPQTLKEVTFTLELKPTDTLMWRIEYRTDFSDKAVFESHDGSFGKTQSSIGFGLLYSFSHKS